DKIDDLILELKDKIKNTKHFSIKIRGFDVFNETIVVLKARNNKTIQKLHEISMKISNKYRKEKDKKFNMKGFKPKQKIYGKKYNNPFCFEFFNPHLSLCYHANPEKIKGIEKYLRKKKLEFKFKVSKISIIDKDEYKIYKHLPIK
ncbi:2'-5' RNA ligase family protein, partial [Candidatus Woesearchaeota archaeon]|nr:2'-5' RNA ligase family protein [Candidatus Woesearchaeota archaeon]